MKQVALNEADILGNKLQFLLPNVAFRSFYDFKFNFQKNTWEKQEGTKNGIKRNHHLDDLAARLQSLLGGYKSKNVLWIPLSHKNRN